MEGNTVTTLKGTKVIKVIILLFDIFIPDKFKYCQLKTLTADLYLYVIVLFFSILTYFW